MATKGVEVNVVAVVVFIPVVAVVVVAIVDVGIVVVVVVVSIIEGLEGILEGSLGGLLVRKSVSRSPGSMLSHQSSMPTEINATLHYLKLHNRVGGIM